MLGNNIYLPGNSVLITDIGEQQIDNRPDPGSALVCVTTNVNTACCRGSDNTNGGALGDFIGPDGVPITTFNNIGNASDIIYSVRYKHHLRLSRRGSPIGPLGKYECKVPVGNTTFSAFIILSCK